MEEKNKGKTWIVKYVDNSTDGVGTCSISGKETKEEVIEFFGLNNPDVYWYDVYEYVEGEEPPKNEIEDYE